MLPAGEAKFNELAGIAQVFMDKRAPYKSSGMVEVHNAVECDDDYDGQTFQVGETTYCRGDILLHTYDSIAKYVGLSGNSMSVHCSNWHRDTEGRSTGRPREYDTILRLGKGTRKKPFNNRSIPEGSTIFKEGSIYYESGFLWKAKNGSYVWVRKLP